MKAYAVVAAAGQSLRMGIPDKNKVFLKLSGRSILEMSINLLVESGCFSGIVIVTREKDRALAKATAEMFPEMPFIYAEGGETRQESVYNAIMKIPEDADIIAVHDAARCFTSPELVRACVESAEKFGSGVAGRMSTDTVKQVHEGSITATLDRRMIALAETPQVFSAELIKKAHIAAKYEGFSATDDAQLVERLGIEPKLVENRNENLKLTYRSDLARGEEILRTKTKFRIGNGIDVHAFKEGRKLVIGGVEIPCAYGLNGHSDADVAVHAIMDALLGAAGLPDIGVQFPDTDDRYKGISSLILLAETVELVREEGYSPVNIDCTLVMQSPKIAPYVPLMKKTLSDLVGCPVNVKATTPEHMGFIGRKEGAEAHATALIESM